MVKVKNYQNQKLFTGYFNCLAFERRFSLLLYIFEECQIPKAFHYSEEYKHIFRFWRSLPDSLPPLLWVSCFCSSCPLSAAVSAAVACAEIVAGNDNRKKQTTCTACAGYSRPWCSDAQCSFCKKNTSLVCVLRVFVLFATVSSSTSPFACPSV